MTIRDSALSSATTEYRPDHSARIVTVKATTPPATRRQRLRDCAVFRCRCDGNRCGAESQGFTLERVANQDLGAGFAENHLTVREPLRWRSPIAFRHAPSRRWLTRRAGSAAAIQRCRKRRVQAGPERFALHRCCRVHRTDPRSRRYRRRRRRCIRARAGPAWTPAMRRCSAGDAAAGPSRVGRRQAATASPRRANSWRRRGQGFKCAAS